MSPPPAHGRLSFSPTRGDSLPPSVRPSVGSGRGARAGRGNPRGGGEGPPAVPSLARTRRAGPGPDRGGSGANRSPRAGEGNDRKSPRGAARPARSSPRSGPAVGSRGGDPPPYPPGPLPGVTSAPAEPPPGRAKFGGGRGRGAPGAAEGPELRARSPAPCGNRNKTMLEGNRPARCRPGSRRPEKSRRDPLLLESLLLSPLSRCGLGAGRSNARERRCSEP